MIDLKKETNILILIFTGIYLILFSPVLVKLVKAWSNSDEYSHGFFIIPVCLYIIWTKKDKIKTISIRGSNAGLVLIIISVLMYISAVYADILTLAPVCMILSLFGILIYLTGFKMTKELAFPIFFLFFMVPIPSQIYSAMTIPLQLFVTKISVLLTGSLSIPIFREGNVIHMADRTLQVVQACSGLRSMISLITLSTIFGYLTLKSNILRLVLLSTGIPIAIFVNIMRVSLMIMSFHYFNFDLTEGSLHTFFGIVVFGIALGIIAIIQRMLVNWDK